MVSVNLLDENLLLWKEFRNGNADAFGELMRTHYQDLFNYGTRFTKDEQLVKDAVQHLFLTLWMNRLTISETSFVKYYLLRSLRYNLVHTIGKSRHRSDACFQHLFYNAPPVEDRLVHEEHLSGLARKMRKVLAGLSRRQQEVIYLRFYMDADADEIAGIMSLTRQSVLNCLHDALRRLCKISPLKRIILRHDK